MPSLYTPQVWPLILPASTDFDSRAHLLTAVMHFHEKNTKRKGRKTKTKTKSSTVHPVANEVLFVHT